MKKPVLILLCGVLLAVILTSCAAKTQDPELKKAPVVSYIPESMLRLNRIGPAVCLREGTEKDGRVVAAAKDISGFTAENLKGNYMIIIGLTAQGQKSLSEATERLSKSGGEISLWGGDTKVRSAGVYAPITGERVAFDETDATQTEKDCVLLSGADPKTVLPGK